MVLSEVTINVFDTHVELSDSVKKLCLHLSFEWLRENCRCVSCYNGVTNQRKFLLFDIKPNIHPKSYSVNANTLEINWNDGHHSQYELEWLITQGKVEKRPMEVLWEGDRSSDVVHVTSTEVKSKDGLTKLIKSLLEHGVGFVTEVEPNLKSTEEVIQRVGPPQQTLFGGMWEFSDKMDHLDTAYTNQALGAHTDTSYFIEPAGLITFHCLKRNCDGGNTLMVDGFRAAKEVQTEAPELYQCLKTVHTEFQYIEKGHHLTSMSPIIKHTPDDRLNQIRYNMYDRSPRLPFPSSECSLFYKAVRRLANVICRPSGQWWIALQPGTVVFINNWRVMHGRSAYTGQRTMAGAYISMGSLLSQARLLSLIH